MPPCFVPGCKDVVTKSKTRSHKFKAPLGVFSKWKEILDKLRKDIQFDKDKVVCYRHFEEKYIIKVNKFRINGENVEMPRFNWGLEKDAIPTIFKGLPASLRPTISKPRREITRLKVLEVKKSYQPRHNIGSTKCVVDTKGNCFLCLDPNPTAVLKKGLINDSSSDPGLCSIKELSGYLNLDMQKISRTSASSMSPEYRHCIDMMEWFVSLCQNCSSQIRHFIGLRREMEETKTRINTCIETINGILLGASRSADIATNMSRTLQQTKILNTLKIIDAEMGKELRTELINKSSTMVLKNARASANKSKTKAKNREVVFVYEDDFDPTVVGVQATVIGQSGTGTNLGNHAISPGVPQNPTAHPANTNININQNHISLATVPTSSFGTETNPSIKPSSAKAILLTTKAVTQIPKTSTSKSNQANCPDCNKSFSSVSVMKRHQTLFHRNGSVDANVKMKTVVIRKDKAKSPSKSHQCVYCNRSFEWDCNLRAHVLSVHRFQEFVKYLPDGHGFSENELLFKLANILKESKEIDNEKTGCMYCARRFTKRERELLVSENHVLLNHFDEIVCKLKAL